MIRPFTCICMLMAAGSGLYLYQTKHRAQMLDHTIALTYKQIDQTKERIGVLKGEWALLNEPERLQDLAQQHLTLKTLAPTQFVAMADLGNHLPAPLPPGSFTLPADDPAPTPVASATPTTAPGGYEKTMVKAAPVAQPAQMAQPAPVAQPAPMAQPSNAVAANEKPPARTVEKLAEKAPERAPEKPAAAPLVATRAANRPTSLVASAQPTPRPMPPPTPINQPATPPAAPAAHIMAPVVNVSAQEVQRPLAPGTVGEAVARANRNRSNAAVILPASSMSQPSYSHPSFGQPSYAGDQGSALGNAGRIALPAPVPYGATQAVR